MLQAERREWRQEGEADGREGLEAGQLVLRGAGRSQGESAPRAGERAGWSAAPRLPGSGARGRHSAPQA